MAITQLDRAEWSAYFDAFSRTQRRAHRTDYAEIRILSMEDGVQREAAWLPLQGLTYDSRDDSLEVALEGLSHVIPHPDTVYVDETADGTLTALEIIRKDGTKDLLEVR